MKTFFIIYFSISFGLLIGTRVGYLLRKDEEEFKAFSDDLGGSE